ncbi:hypothetical protein [Nonomuraea sp. NPDC005650]|uniref:hypothetical protein n=1 Tax=Nonomuraea sp. NPDC005650 TaxID=3157045 RepID=UPI0033A987FD
MNRTLSFRRLRPATGAALVLLLVAACGSAPSGEGDAAGTPSSGKPASTASASPSPTAAAASPSPSPSAGTPTPSARPLPRASDGKRYSACRDGTCEVAVSRPMRITVKGGRLTVIKVKPNSSLKFDLTFTYGGGGSGVLKGTCGVIATFFRYAGGGAMEGCASEDSTPKKPARVKGALRMQLVGWDSDKAAVLRLVSG